MRISDWSSDVCSSDLQAQRTLKGGGLHSLAQFGKPKEVVAAQPAAEMRDLDLPVAYGHARARAVGLVGTCHDRLDHAANLHRYRGRPLRSEPVEQRGVWVNGKACMSPEQGWEIGRAHV